MLANIQKEGAEYVQAVAEAGTLGPGKIINTNAPAVKWNIEANERARVAAERMLKRDTPVPPA